jgi:hypothetical protein
MSDTVDQILAELDRADDVDYWTAERIADLEVVSVFSTYGAEIITALDGIPVTIRLTYNDVDDGFFVDILATDGSIDVKGLRASTNADMLDGLALSELGRLVVIDLERGLVDPIYEDFGGRFGLFYLPQASK